MLLGLLIMSVFFATFITPFIIGSEIPKTDEVDDADLQKIEKIPQGAKTGKN